MSIYVYKGREGCEQLCGVWWLLALVGLTFAWCSTEDIPRSDCGLIERLYYLITHLMTQAKMIMVISSSTSFTIDTLGYT